MSPRSLGMRIMKKLPRCASCGTQIDAYSGDSPQPKPGDFCVCDICFGINVFVSSSTLEARVATDTEVEEAVKGMRADKKYEKAWLLEACLARRRKSPRA